MADEFYRPESSAPRTPPTSKLDLKDQKIAELEQERDELLEKMKSDAWCLRAMLQLLHENGIEPGSRELIEASKRWKREGRV